MLNSLLIRLNFEIVSGELFHFNNQLYSTDLGLEHLNVLDLLNSVFKIELLNIFPEISLIDLCKVKHVIDDKRQELLAGVLYHQALNLLVFDAL